MKPFFSDTIKRGVTKEDFDLDDVKLYSDLFNLEDLKMNSIIK